MDVTVHTPHTRRFVPGTIGWTEDDLYEPRIERLWENGHYEIVEGILTKMPRPRIARPTDEETVVQRLRNPQLLDIRCLSPNAGMFPSRRQRLSDRCRGEGS